MNKSLKKVFTYLFCFLAAYALFYAAGWAAVSSVAIDFNHGTPVDILKYSSVINEAGAICQETESGVIGMTGEGSPNWYRPVLDFPLPSQEYLVFFRDDVTKPKWIARDILRKFDPKNDYCEHNIFK